MAATFTPDYEVVEIEPTGRRRKITKFALAGVAVLGVGAALTSAAWSDNVWFRADAAAGTLDLEGSSDGSNWIEADTEGAAIVLDDFAVLGSNDSISHTIYVRNTGTVDIALANPLFTTEGDLFDGSLHDDPGASYDQDAASVSFEVAGWNNAVIGPNQTAEIDIIVSTPDWENLEYVGATGQLTVQVQGTS